MTQKTDYTPEEWHVLKDVPMLGGLAVMLATGDEKGTTKENWTLMQAMADGAADYPANALLQDLLRADEWDEAAQQHLQAAFHGQTREQVLATTLAQVEAAATLLGQKSNDVESGEYKHWVITIAQAVARASKEGSFLGIGGQRVSAAEKDFISQFAQALGVTEVKW